MGGRSRERFQLRLVPPTGLQRPTLRCGLGMGPRHVICVTHFHLIICMFMLEKRSFGIVLFTINM